MRSILEAYLALVAYALNTTQPASTARAHTFANELRQYPFCATPIIGERYQTFLNGR